MKDCNNCIHEKVGLKKYPCSFCLKNELHADMWMDKEKTILESHVQRPKKMEFRLKP